MLGRGKGTPQREGRGQDWRRSLMVDKSASAWEHGDSLAENVKQKRTLTPEHTCLHVGANFFQEIDIHGLTFGHFFVMLTKVRR